MPAELPQRQIIALEQVCDLRPAVKQPPYPGEVDQPDAELGIAGGEGQGALGAGSAPSEDPASPNPGAGSAPDPTPPVSDLEPPAPGADQGAS